MLQRYKVITYDGYLLFYMRQGSIVFDVYRRVTGSRAELTQRLVADFPPNWVIR